MKSLEKFRTGSGGCSKLARFEPKSDIIIWLEAKFFYFMWLEFQSHFNRGTDFLARSLETGLESIEMFPVCFG